MEALVVGKRRGAVQRATLLLLLHLERPVGDDAVLAVQPASRLVPGPPLEPGRQVGFDGGDRGYGLGKAARGRLSLRIPEALLISDTRKRYLKRGEKTFLCNIIRATITNYAPKIYTALHGITHGGV